MTQRQPVVEAGADLADQCRQRSINWWLITSASAGVSLRVETNIWLARMGRSVAMDETGHSTKAMADRTVQ
jgi:hypothetical protein